MLVPAVSVTTPPAPPFALVARPAPPVAEITPSEVVALPMAPLLAVSWIVPPAPPAILLPLEGVAPFAVIVTVPLAAERILPWPLVTVMAPPALVVAPTKPELFSAAKVISPILALSEVAPELSDARVHVVMLTAPLVTPAAAVVVIEVPAAMVKAALPGSRSAAMAPASLIVAVKPPLEVILALTRMLRPAFRVSSTELVMVTALLMVMSVLACNVTAEPALVIAAGAIVSVPAGLAA